MIVTEYGVARLRGCSMRERAQALIDIAHPDDRPMLIKRAKAHKVIYQDQIFLPESARLYPANIHDVQTFKGGYDESFSQRRLADQN